MLEEIASASDKVGSDTNALGSPNETNPNYFAGRNWFGFVFYDHAGRVDQPHYGASGLHPQPARRADGIRRGAGQTLGADNYRLARQVHGRTEIRPERRH